MGRRRRPDLPGGIVHLTARTLRRERLFTPPLRASALQLVAWAIAAADARLLAVAIMPNHLHLVVQQGERPLSALMQPLLRRLAIALQREHGLEGPIFWRPYGSQPCLDPEHARNAIVYTHLNPVRANLCASPADYAWTSHGLYSGDSEAAASPELRAVARVLDSSAGLALFASGRDPSPEELRREYVGCVEWRMAMDRAQHDALAAADPPTRLPLRRTLLHPQWSRGLTPLFHQSVRLAGGAAGPRPRDHAPDLCDIARRTVAAAAPSLRLELLKGRGGGAEHTRLRHLMIRQMHAAGYRNAEIARFLRLSESAVSKVIRAATRIA